MAMLGQAAWMLSHVGLAPLLVLPTAGLLVGAHGLRRQEPLPIAAGFAAEIWLMVDSATALADRPESVEAWVVLASGVLCVAALVLAVRRVGPRVGRLVQPPTWVHWLRPLLVLGLWVAAVRASVECRLYELEDDGLPHVVDAVEWLASFM
jgi:hypothetical protein